MNVGCVIMAAGQSRRFGSNKLLAPLMGRPLLEYVLDSLPVPSLARITVVTTHDPVEALCRARGLGVVRNTDGTLSESVRRGIAGMEGLDGCLFLMGDQPLCPRQRLEELLAAFACSPHCVHRLSWDGVPGSPVLFPARLFSRLAALTGEQGGMAAVRGSGTQVILLPAAHPWELWDADTPLLLEQIRTLLEEKELL